MSHHPTPDHPVLPITTPMRLALIQQHGPDQAASVARELFLCHRHPAPYADWPGH